MPGAARTSVYLCFYQWGVCQKAESRTQTAFVECPSTLFGLNVLGFILEKNIFKKKSDRNNPNRSLICYSDQLDLLFKVDLSAAFKVVPCGPRGLLQPERRIGFVSLD